mgnify:FL=1
MLNHIVICGRMTADPEPKVTNSGLTVLSFSVAVERDIPNKDTGKREVDFIDCTAWRKTAEFITTYFQKGSMIIVDGRLQIRSYEDSNGQKRRRAEILVDHAYFGGTKHQDNEASPKEPSYEPIEQDDPNFPF